MSLCIEVRLPSQPREVEREIERSLREAAEASPARGVWAVSILEAEGGEWILLATGGVYEPEVEPNWTFVAVDNSGEESVCTYALVLRDGERSLSAIGQSLQRLLLAPVSKHQRVSL